ncbi:MAG: NAD(P)-binding domain-containing protein [Ilumatobacteraceae bacterium]
MSPTFYTAADADGTALDGLAVCVVGFGHLGSSMARNLRDGGLAVTVANVDDEYRAVAASDGFSVGDIEPLVGDADIVFVLVPDEAIPEVFRTAIAPSLRRGAAIVFASGYCLAYGLVEAPADVDVLLLAPRMLGDEVRRAAVEGTGFVSYVSVEQDASGSAHGRLLALAAAAGALCVGALELSAEQEATLDLFVEQTVGPYLGTAIQLAFEVGTAAGVPAEAMVLELYQSGEMARTFQTFADVGFYRSVTWHGIAAQFGGFERTLEMDVDAMRAHFATVLADIRSGGFASRLQREHEDGYPTMRSIAGITSGDDPMSQAEERARSALGTRRRGRSSFPPPGQPS